MAYNRTYLLKRIFRAQLLVRRIQKEHKGLPMTEIYRQYIANEFHISKATFDRWMGVNVPLEMNKIEKRAKRKQK